MGRSYIQRTGGLQERHCRCYIKVAEAGGLTLVAIYGAGQPSMFADP